MKTPQYIKSDFKVQKQKIYHPLIAPLTILSISILIIWTFPKSFISIASEKYPSDLRINTNFYQDKVVQLNNSPVWEEFNILVEQFSDKNLVDENEFKNRAENLAAKRSEILKELIQFDPKLALEKSISVEKYNFLPSFVTKHLEKRFSVTGDFHVYAVHKIDQSTGKINGSLTRREVVVGDSRYEAFVYGRREAMTTKLNIPLQGIIIDGIMAVDENFTRKVDSFEYKTRKTIKSKFDDGGIAAEVGGKIAFSRLSRL
ncbi:MAG TPA: hypothetical protein VF556_00750 [Pyrinomonadaceae bacterium]|jgi:hypothetical protein